jgi:Ser/Thr protein kinase RdoA (MazF antagonist)
MDYIGQFIPKHETIARREFDEVVEWASSLRTGPDTFGLVHTDLNFSNIFVGESSSITAFDFDDCHYNWFAYDLSVPLFYALISFDLPSLDATKQGWFYGPFLEGYTRHMDISDEWIKRIPGFIRFRRADLFAFICKELDIDNLTDAWDIKAIQRIREGFFIQEPLV